MSKLRTAMTLSILLPALVAGVAQAQQPALTDPAAIAACLCLERTMADRQREMTLRQGIYERVKADVDRLGRDIETKRPKVNVDLPADVTAFRELLDEQDAAQDTLMRSALPDFQGAVAAYNETVATFNRSCVAGYHPTILESVRKTLTCPAE